MNNLPPELAGLKLPVWSELPDLDLYMDQVLSLAEKYLGPLSSTESHRITASMINNYVKLGVMPAPVKKKYSREHLAYVVMICVLKSVLPISDVRQLIDRELESSDFPSAYNRFCSCFGQASAEAYEAAEGCENDAALVAALRAQAEQTLAESLLSKSSTASN